MTQTITYAQAIDAPTWTETIATTRRDELELAERAEHGDVGTGSAVLDDPDRDLGHLADGIVGWKPFLVDNDAMDPARLFTGFTYDRTYHRGPYRAGGSRQISVTLHDENTLLGLREITGADGNRPAETIAARVAWLLASGYASGVTDDEGWVNAPGTLLDATDFRYQYPGDVLADCVNQARNTLNYFVRWSADTGSFCLWFDDPNTSETYTSAIKISNVIEDVDGDDYGLTVYPDIDARLSTTPERVVSGTAVQWMQGTEYVTRPATAAAFIERDRSAPNANARTATAARRAGRKLLAENRTEEDRIGVRIILPEPQASAVHAGMRMSVKFSHFAAYDDWTWMRVVALTRRHPPRRDNAWEVDLDLVPIEGGGCADAVDVNQSDGTVTQYLEVVSGAATVAHGTISGWFGGPVDTAVNGPITATDPAAANDGDTTTACGLPWTIALRGTACVGTYFETDLGGDFAICSTKGTAQIGAISWGAREPDTIEWWDADNSTWVTAAGTLTFTPDLPTPKYWIFTFAEIVTTSKLRLGYIQCGVAGIFGLWGYYGVRVYDWQVLAV